ncbi:MAG: PAS domain-containing protein, partial [Desulfomonilia bacterium]
MTLPEKADARLSRELEKAHRRIVELEKKLSPPSSMPDGPGERTERPLHIDELFKSLPLGLTITDEQGRIVACNREAERLLGVSCDEQEKRTITGSEWRVVRPDGTPMPPEEFPAVKALKERRHIENASMGIVKGTGEIQWISVTAAPISLPGYGVAAVYGDFTRGREVEEALRISEQRYQQLFEDDLAGNFVARPDGRILMCNQSFVRIFGFTSKEEALSSRISELYLSPGGFADFIALLKDRKELRDYGDKRRRRDGSVIHIVENAVARFDKHGELVEYRAWTFDDTQRKCIEDELRHSEERFRIMADSSPLMIWVVDETGTLRFVNSRYRGYFDAPAEEVAESSRSTRIHPEDRDSYMKDFMDALRNRSPFHSITRMRRADGRWRWVESFGNPWPSLEGAFIGMVCSGMDVTERVEAQEALFRYRDRLEELVRKRTSELEKRNRKLAREIAERRRAEEAEKEALSQLMHSQKIEALGRFA